MNQKTIDRMGDTLIWTFFVGAIIGIVSVVIILAGKAWETLRPFLLVLALSLTACGFNPMEGDFGVIEWVPEQKECKTKVRYPDGRVNYEMRPCDGGGHDVEVFGHWRYL